MAKMTFNAENVRQPLVSWPDGPVTATINAAELTTSKSSGEPMIVVEFEVFHPEYGTSTLRDYLPFAFGAKCTAFYQSFYRLNAQELKAEMAENNGDLELDDQELVGGTMIVVLGDVENQDGKTYKNVVAPWYYSDDRDDVLPDAYHEGAPF